jgi:hypothetical protein
MLHPPVAAVWVEIVSSAARRNRQRRCAVTLYNSRQRGLYDDTRATRFHRARIPLKDFDVRAVAVQRQAGAKTTD